MSAEFRFVCSYDDALNPPPRDPGSNPTVDWRREKRSNEMFTLAAAAYNLVRMRNLQAATT